MWNSSKSGDFHLGNVRYDLSSYGRFVQITVHTSDVTLAIWGLFSYILRTIFLKNQS